MKLRHVVIPLLAFAAVAFAQNQPCLISAPPAPPKATQVICKLPGDGGTTGCTCQGSCPSCDGAGAVVAVTNVQCAAAVGIGDRSVVNGNGWNDGGTQ